MNGLKNRLLLQRQFQTKRVLIHYCPLLENRRGNMNMCIEHKTKHARKIGTICRPQTEKHLPFEGVKCDGIVNPQAKLGHCCRTW